MGVFLYERGNRAVVTLAAISGKGYSSRLTLTTAENKSLMQLESLLRARNIHNGLIWIKIFIKIHMTTMGYTCHHFFHSLSPVVYEKKHQICLHFWIIIVYIPQLCPKTTARSFPADGCPRDEGRSISSTSQ